MVPVSYLIELRDAFSAAAERVAKAARDAMRGAQGMGQAVNAAEKAVASAGAAFNAASGGYRKVAVGADTAAVSHKRLATEVAAAQRVMNKFADNPRFAHSAGRGGALFGGMPSMHHLWQAWFGIELGRMALHGVDTALTAVGDVEAMKEKLRFSLGSGRFVAGKDGGQVDLIQSAYDESFRLSGVYKNTSVLENMKILDDLRANLPEKFEHLVNPEDGLFAPFVKLHGFFKAWEGGKHANVGEQTLKDIGAAIRSGELLGSVTAKDLAQHADSLAAARVVFGHKFKVQEYFQGVQKAVAALSSADDTFKYVDFAVLTQRLAQGGGVSLATSFQKLIGGTRITQGTAEAWRRLGLVDMDQVTLDKKGFIQTKLLPGHKWLKDSDAYGVNLTDALMTKVLPALQFQGGVPIKGFQMAHAWKEGNVEKLTELLSDFRKKPENMLALTRQLTALGYDRNAIRAWEELILGSGSIMRDRQRMLQIRKDFENYESYTQAKQSLGAQANRFWLELFGSNMPGVTSTINAVATALGALTDAMHANPMLGEGVRWAVMAAGALAVAAAFGMVGRAMRFMFAMTGVPAIFSFFGGAGRATLTALGMTRVAAAAGILAGGVRLLVGATGLGALAMGAWTAYENWDKLRGAIQSVNDLLGLKAGQGQSLADAARTRQGSWFASQEETARVARERWSNLFGLGVGAATAATDAGRLQIDIPTEIIIKNERGAVIGSIPIAVRAPRGRAVDDMPLYAN